MTERNVWESYDYLEDEISVNVVADSYRESNGTRVTTMLWRVPRFLLPQLNTYRVLSRSVSSSRAKRFTKTVQEVRRNPYTPYVWQANHAGMQGEELLELWKVPFVNALWKASMWSQTAFAQLINSFGVSKQYTNRLIEPYMYVDYLVTSTTFDNFIKQRDNYHAQLEIQIVARRLKLALRESEPKILEPYDWHIPFVNQETFEAYGLYDSLKLSVARCARTSYGTPSDISEVGKDLKLFARLATDGHLSPFEHVVVAYGEYGGNLTGVGQLRKILELHLENNDDIFDDTIFKGLIEELEEWKSESSLWESPALHPSSYIAA